VNAAATFSLRTLDDFDLPALLELYRACEDFLALGPYPRDSLEMVRSDIQLSQENGARFRGFSTRTAG